MSIAAEGITGINIGAGLPMEERIFHAEGPESRGENMSVRQLFRWGTVAAIATGFVVAALCIDVSRAGNVFNNGGAVKGRPPGSTAGMFCVTGGPTACISCAAGTGFYCIAGPPTPPVAGGTWWIGTCQTGTTAICNDWAWNCGSSMTCTTPPVWTGSNCNTFELCNQ